jgi:hypothetical protein
MTCQKYRDALVALARQAGEPEELERVRAHLESCDACRQKFDNQQALTAGLQALAEASRHEQPPDALEGRLMTIFDQERAHAATQPAVRPGVWLRWLPAAAAAALAIGAAAWWLAGGPPRTPAPQPASAPAGIIELAGFQPLPQAVGLPDLDSGKIVRTEIAVSALPVYGVRIPPDAAAAAVTVDFLVGQDGQPRMIRLVAEDPQDARSR